MSADTGQQSSSFLSTVISWVFDRVDDLVDDSPRLETILQRVCPSITVDRVKDGKGISWSQKCGQEFLTNLENKHKHVTQPETIIASTLGPATGIGVGLGLPFAFRWLKELSIFRWTSIS